MHITRAKIVIGVVGLFLLSLLISGLVLGFTNKHEKGFENKGIGAIVTNSFACSGIGSDIFKKGFFFVT